MAAQAAGSWRASHSTLLAVKPVGTTRPSEATDTDRAIAGAYRARVRTLHTRHVATSAGQGEAEAFEGADAN